ncbi:hypothetical protein Metig_0946 [Methanotorris igneus Kol 5]|uniref:Uncharacterized protein n=2 Tax=Methanotorris igneus TaxID=2189 RepID=F6BDC8_METIK|nr:hypothetical protein Metig_0946 [Methanotorris igneus Kol 5]
MCIIGKMLLVVCIGFVKYTMMFFGVGFLLSLIILYVDIYVVRIFLGIILALLWFVYIWYVAYKILVSKYCWIILLPVLLLALMSGIIPFILLVLWIYVCRVITISSKRSLEKKGIYNLFDLIRYIRKSSKK